MDKPSKKPAEKAGAHVALANPNLYINSLKNNYSNMLGFPPTWGRWP